MEKFIPDGRNPGYMKVVHGGVARNVAEDLARQGLSPVFVSLSDHSALASDVAARLEKSGVDTRFVFPTDAGMGTWMAIFNEKGDVAANISIRPDLAPLTELLEEHHKEIFEDTDGILLEIDIEPAAMEKVFYYAEKYGKKVYSLISVMSIALERKEYFPRTECFVCNLQEAGMLFEEDLEQYSPHLLAGHIAKLAKAEGFSKLIVTLGENGAVYADCHQTMPDGSPLSGWCPAENVDVVDTTGAGDAFCAGAVAALIGGSSLEEACVKGSRLASLVITSTENVCPPGNII